MGERVTIIGDGQMGLVMAGLLAEQGHEARLWGPFPEELRQLDATRRSLNRLPGYVLPPGVRVTTEPAAALAETQFIVDAIPTQFIRRVWSGLRPHVPSGAAVASVSKGLEQETLLRPLQVVADVLGESHDLSDRPMVCVSGPTIAAELAEHKPATVVAASTNSGAAAHAQRLLNCGWFRVYTNEDVVGVEIAGAVKNVIALAAGMVDGMNLGCNAKSALLARGLAEIARLGIALGARTQTFFGVAGVGDLATTCFSPQGRNRTCGERLGRGESLSHVESSTVSVIEGVATTRSVRALANRMGVEMPITEAVYRILFDRMKPIEAIALLMDREPKAERFG